MFREMAVFGNSRPVFKNPLSIRMKPRSASNLIDLRGFSHNSCLTRCFNDRILLGSLDHAGAKYRPSDAAMTRNTRGVSSLGPGSDVKPGGEAMRKQRLLLAALVLLMSVPVFAQKFTASIRGTVTDTSNAVIAGAKVTLKNEETGLNRTMTTNTAGNFSFPDLPVGSYRVEVEFTGFKTAVRTKIGISVADVRAVDIQLSTGELSETVSVEASSPSRRARRSDRKSTRLNSSHQIISY